MGVRCHITVMIENIIWLRREKRDTPISLYITTINIKHNHLRRLGGRTILSLNIFIYIDATYMIIISVLIIILLYYIPTKLVWKEQCLQPS